LRLCLVVGVQLLRGGLERGQVLGRLELHDGVVKLRVAADTFLLKKTIS
jgi:hypothetical protein